MGVELGSIPNSAYSFLRFAFSLELHNSRAGHYPMLWESRYLDVKWQKLELSRRSLVWQLGLNNS